MATLYAFRFNNYYNRRLKKSDSIIDYGNPVLIESDTYCNFNPNDGIDTQIVLGRPGINDYDGTADYLIYSADNVNITSRWYIIEQQRKMGEQYTVTLHRDVLADNWDKVLNSECFIEKAILPDTNPLVLNSEDVYTNQIKTSELLIKDKYKTAWICAFITDKDENDSALPTSTTIRFKSELVLDGEYDDWEDYPYNNYLGKTAVIGIEFNSRIYFRIQKPNNSFEYKVFFNDSTIDDVNIWGVENSDATRWFMHGSGLTIKESDVTAALDSLNNNIPASLILNYGSKYSISAAPNKIYTTNNSLVNSLFNENNNVYKIDNAFYKISCNYHPIFTNGYSVISNVDGIYLKTAVESALSPYAIDGEAMLYWIKFSVYEYGLYSSEIQKGTYSYTIDSDNHYKLKDAPWSCLCFPYNDDVEIDGYQTSKLLTMSAAQALGEQLGGYVQDIQILPFCPMTGFTVNNDGSLTSLDVSNDRMVSIMNEDDNSVIGYAYWSTMSSMNGLQILLDEPIYVDNPKMENQTDMYRLCAPNYSKQFEFQLTKNGGRLVGFDVDFTYLPISSYIRVAPIFEGLYGRNFSDGRGLIAGGSASISYLSDKWVNYQQNNANYQNSFDRGITHMEVEYKQQNIKNTVGAVTGALTTGLAVGAIAGPGAGVAAGLASGVGGAVDVMMAKELQKENISYAKDQFDMNLQNIKAMPDTIASITSFTANNKIYPVLEYYTCTPEEKEYFAKKIAWNSMSVGVVGKISDFINNRWNYGEITDKGYIKGRLIRIEGLDDDSHMASVIADELNQGVFTNNG